jgi:hypothetical protein
MNDKIRELLENAEQSDAIARNKWRIENREQLRKERKQKLKELMEKDKQQTAVKLYTQEQLIKYLRNHSDIITRYDLQNIPPIELPSDEELRKEFDVDEFDPYDVAYLGGAIRMRNKIQGNKE